ncbi:MAG: hypothetical protein IKO47_00340 [Ruminococcus sp.]|nr:hypothetical protein [Ruminococcus sp.]
MKLSMVISAAAAAAVLTACSSGTKTVSEVQPTTSAVSPESVVFSWQQAYEEKLNSFRSSDKYVPGTSGSMFDLHDLDGDGTPELVISPSAENDAACEIYTMSGSSAVLVGTSGTKGTFGFIPAQKAISFWYNGKNFELREFFAVKEGKLVTLKKFYNNRSAVSSGGRMNYEIDNETVRVAEYERVLAGFTSDTELRIGRKFTFADQSLNYAVHYSESWGAVLTEQQKEFYTSVLTERLADGSADAAYELCDIDHDNVPELIYSEGGHNGAVCTVYRTDGFTISQTAAIPTRDGRLAFDPQNNICYDFTSRVSEVYAADGTASGTAPSDNMVMCGRKYILREDTLADAFR